MQITLDSDDLRPLVAECLAQMLDRLPGDSRLSSRLTYSEEEAAALLGVPRHVLRGERSRQNIVGFKVGRYVRYSRQALLDFIRKKEGRE